MTFHIYLSSIAEMKKLVYLLRLSSVVELKHSSLLSNTPSSHLHLLYLPLQSQVAVVRVT
jgi:hypothetical protein